MIRKYGDQGLVASGGHVVINPIIPVVMGCGETLDAVGHIHDNLEANVLVLRDGYACAVVVSVDALYIGSRLRHFLENRLRGQVKSEYLFLAASHVHSAPQLDHSKPALGLPNDDHLEGVFSRIGELIERLINEEGHEVRIQVTRYRSRVMVNRRKKRFLGGSERRVVLNSVTMSPNPEATGEQHGHLIALIGEESPVGFLWSLPCHPTSHPLGFGHSAGYPGFGRSSLRALTEGSVPVLFLQGFSGDLRPPAYRPSKGWIGLMRRALVGLEFAKFTEAGFMLWIKQVVEELMLAHHDILNESAATGSRRLDAKRIEIPLTEYHEGESDGRKMVVHRLSIGDVSLIGVSAEPVSAYASWLVERGGKHLVPVGCIDDVVGYAPTSKIIEEGGYEGGGFLKWFNVGQLRPRYERLLRSQLDSVLIREGRKASDDSWT